jgi:hypothetical protein
LWLYVNLDLVASVTRTRFILGDGDGWRASPMGASLGLGMLAGPILQMRLRRAEHRGQVLEKPIRSECAIAKSVGGNRYKSPPGLLTRVAAS